jgi:nucleotide-binding universal stress UspA family protein
MAVATRILVPVDFSEMSQKALDYALDLGAKLGASVHVVHVCPLLYYALGADLPDDPAFERKLKEQLRHKLEALQKSLSDRGHKITTSLVDGNPGQQISEVATQQGADLIVMATHGRTGMQHLMLGSVAERVVRTAKLPVLTVR